MQLNEKLSFGAIILVSLFSVFFMKSTGTGYLTALLAVVGAWLVGVLFGMKTVERGISNR